MSNPKFITGSTFGGYSFPWRRPRQFRARARCRRILLPDDNDAQTWQLDRTLRQWSVRLPPPPPAAIQLAWLMVTSFGLWRHSGPARQYVYGGDHTLPAVVTDCRSQRVSTVTRTLPATAYHHNNTITLQLSTTPLS